MLKLVELGHDMIKSVFLLHLFLPLDLIIKACLTPLVEQLLIKHVRVIGCLVELVLDIFLHILKFVKVEVWSH